MYARIVAVQRLLSNFFLNVLMHTSDFFAFSELNSNDYASSNFFSVTYLFRNLEQWKVPNFLKTT